ncbi:MAG: hypothetical protein ACOYWZ_17780 [Bacillota bacterium]
MGKGDILDEYPYILKTLRELNGELNQIIKSKELMEDTLKYSRKADVNISSHSLDPTLKAVERVLDKYENNISYIAGRIDILKERKKKLDKTL